MTLLGYELSNVEWAFVGLYAFLILASGIVVSLKNIRKDKNYSEVALRIRSWWVIIILFSFAVLGGRGMGVGFLAFVSFLGLKEFFSMIPTRRADRRVLLWAYAAIPIQAFFIYIEWYGLFIIFIPIYMFLALPLKMILIGETRSFLKSMSTIHWGLMATVYSMGHIAYLLVLPTDKPHFNGPGLVLFLVAMTQLNDVAQFCWGKALGGPKITPTVSPNKTWAGFLGGVVTITGLSILIAPYLTPFDFQLSVFAGLLLSIGGFLGDLTISAIKRDLGVKDFGSILPGHGGIMDRIDSLCYTAPLFFHFTRFYG